MRETAKDSDKCKKRENIMKTKNRK